MKFFATRCLAVFAFIFCSTAAHADGGRLSVPDNKGWKEECGSCHIAFPPQLLTADNWQRLMGGLDKHFGVNAALDAQSGRDIAAFLQRYAGKGDRHAASSLKISDTSWFTREHREVSAKTWNRPEVKSRANCTACHVNAEKGDWSERGIRMPGGQRMEDDDD